MNIIFTDFKYRKPLIPLELDKVKYIVLHHTASIRATPKQVHQWHLERDNGTWAGFGYAEMIAKDGTVYIGRGDYIGAHVKNMNSQSYGICVEGNYDIELTMPPEQRTSLVERIKYNLPRFININKVCQHKTLQSDTACPGQHFPFYQILQEVFLLFKDDSDISEYAQESVERIAKLGIIKGDDKGYFHPKQIVSRQDLAVVIDRLINYLKAKG